MMGKPIRALELYYSMIQFLIIKLSQVQSENIMVFLRNVSRK